MIIWNGTELVALGIAATLGVTWCLLWSLEVFMFWLEKKKIITSKWRVK